MFTDLDLTKVGKATPSRLAQSVFIATGRGGFLATRHEISDEAWNSLWTAEKSRLGASWAPFLIRSAGNAERLAKVLELPSDSSGKAAIAVALQLPGELDPKLAEAMYKKFSPSASDDALAAAICISTGLLEKSLVAQFLNNFLDYNPGSSSNTLLFGDERFRSRLLLQAATLYDSLSDPDLARILCANSWTLYKENKYSLLPSNIHSLNETAKLWASSTVAEVRPGLVGTVLDAQPFWPLHPTIAASKHLSDLDASRLLTLIRKTTLLEPRTSSLVALCLLTQNPNVSYSSKLEAYLLLGQLGVELTSTSGYSRVALATTAGEGGVGNTECAPLDSNRDTQTVATNHDAVRESLTDEYVASELSPYLDSLGATAWELFIQLLPGWDQPVAELLEVIDTILKR